MKKLLLIIPLLMWILAETNPKQKGRYTEYVAAELQSLCCRRTSSTTFTPCHHLRPITDPLVKGIVYWYTDPPTNYVFFTLYTTRLPARTVYGIGVAGKFAAWPEKGKENWKCGISLIALRTLL